MKKSVLFNENVIVYDTYSRDEYDRTCIHSVLYKVLHEKNNASLSNIYKTLSKYKLNEMIVHVDTL